ncbi:MAG: hypothetical protein DMF91_19965 [Acidobacteria bacterium]|nr:MAG: hypothetical protein DMF91_19965 [Acidobacteriota bacterium]
MVPSPLLEFFKRGEAARDVRLLAAQGGLGVRAHDQLAILVLLLDDPDPEIRTTADATLNRIPSDVLSRFLGRSDIPIGIREFFADRGIFPAGDAALDSEQPLVEAEHDDAFAADEDEDKDTVSQKIAAMSMPEKLKAATKGTKEMRAILVRDPNKLICAAVMSSPKLTEQEVEGIARTASVSEDVLRIIGANRAWMKNYKIASGLTRNPKTPLALSLNILHRINDRDLATLAVDRNVPEQLRIAAKKKIGKS